MTFRREIELTCDGTPGAPFSCPTPAIFALTVPGAWRDASREGWVRRVVGGKVIHLCPRHKGARTRGTCSICGRDQMVTLNGVIGPHRERNPDGSYRRYAPWCAGRGKPPRAVTGSVSDPRAETGTGQ